MFQTGDVRDQTGQALLEVFVEKSVHDRIGADWGHGWQVAGWEYHQHHFLVLLAVTKRLQCIDDNVEYVERSPGQEEDDADRDQNGVDLLPPHHLSWSPVGWETLAGLPRQTMTNSAENLVKKTTLRFSRDHSGDPFIEDWSSLIKDSWTAWQIQIGCKLILTFLHVWSEKVGVLTLCRQSPPPHWEPGTGRQSRPRCRLSCCVEGPSSAVRADILIKGSIRLKVLPRNSKSTSLPSEFSSRPAWSGKIEGRRERRRWPKLRRTEGMPAELN